MATRSLAYNTDLVAKEQAPRTYQDLLDPRWKGAFVWNPNAMTGAWGFIATVLRHMGEEQGHEYLRKLAKQEIVPLPIATRAVLDRVIAGEYAMGLEMVNAHVAISAGMGAPVRWVPLDATTTTLQIAGVTTGRRIQMQDGCSLTSSPRVRDKRSSARSTTSPCIPTFLPRPRTQV